MQQADLASTRAQVQQAKALRDQAATQLGYTKIYSPLDGIVSVRVALQGEMVAQGGPIVVVVDVDHLWVRADVEETYIDAIGFGDTMKVQLPSGDDRSKAKFSSKALRATSPRNATSAAPSATSRLSPSKCPCRIPIAGYSPG